MTGRAIGAAAIAAALALLLLLPALGAAPFDDPGEGQHAEIARELFAGGDWLALRLNGVPYFDKPPLLYWVAAASFAAFGTTEWAARLGPAVGAALAAAGTAALGARLLGPGAGVAAAGALLSSALFLVFGQYVRPETLFVAAVQWGFTGLLLGLGATGDGRGSRGWLLVGAGGLAAASLAKDPLGLLGPVTAVAVALGLAGRLEWARARWSWAALLLVLAGGFGWYLIAAWREPGFAWYTVVDNHLLNVLRLRRFPDEDVPLTTPEFLAVSALGAFPWAIGAALEVGRLARGRAWREPGEAPWVALALWTAGLVGFFAVAPFKLPHYALPAYPAIALLAVRRWTVRAERPRALIGVHLACFAAIFAAGLVVASGDGRAFTEAVFSATDVYTRKEAVAGQASPLPPWTVLGPLLTRLALIFGAGALALLVAIARRAAGLGLWIVLATMLAAMPSATTGARLVATGRAVAALAADVRRVMGPGDLLAHEGPIENSGALELYSGRRPVLVEATRSVLGIGATRPESRGTFWDRRDLARAWTSDRRVLLVTPRAPGHTLVAAFPPETVHLLESKNGRWLYSNRPADAVGAPAGGARVAAPSPHTLP